MYKIKNGILYKDDQATFALGESYYPSFHPCKYPVKPEEDRMGEMKKDLRMMAEAGFNHVRFAALGEVSFNAEKAEVSLDSPFIDTMIKEAGQDDLSVSVRLQGFSVNPRGFEDAGVLDQRGEVPEFAWSDFVRSNIHHQGILEDNFIHARDLAKHFSAFSNVVGYQIYNEPKFPQPHKVVCDYNPHSVEAFRQWLLEKKILTEEEAKSYQPPRSLKEQDPKFWALWRLFSAEGMAGFLDNAARGAKAGADRPTFTCLTADTACKTNPRRGVDAFADAKSMDLIGYTIYKHAWGAEYYPFCLDGDTFQSAAASEGKEAWCIELDSRTYIPSSVYNKGTYATIGSGVKGIIFYQWRGDQPVEGVPHPNSCGILNYDGTKTENFENAIAVNRWIASVNDLLMGAERAKEGIGLFYSLHAAAYCDALENNDESKNFFNSAALCYNQLYAELRKAGFSVSIIDGEHLKDNRAEVKALIVPDMAHLSAKELSAIDRFWEQGGTVLVNYDPGAPTKAFTGLSLYDKIERTYEQKVFLPPLTAFDLPALTGIKPTACSLSPNLGVQTLKGKDYTLLVLTNISTIETNMDAKVQINISFKKATFTAIDGEKKLTIEGNTLTVHDLTDGGILILK